MDKVLAIDFDGCLCANKFPDIGEPHWPVIHKAQDEQANGAKLILWTCREGALLDAAVAVCKRWGLEFDAVNDSLESWKVRFGNDSRKIGATEYWDDRAVRMDGNFAYSRPVESGRKMTRQRMTGLQGSRKVKEKQLIHQKIESEKQK